MSKARSEATSERLLVMLEGGNMILLSLRSSRTSLLVNPYLPPCNEAFRLLLLHSRFERLRDYLGRDLELSANELLLPQQGFSLPFLCYVTQG